MSQGRALLLLQGVCFRARHLAPARPGSVPCDLGPRAAMVGATLSAKMAAFGRPQPTGPAPLVRQLPGYLVAGGHPPNRGVSERRKPIMRRPGSPLRGLVTALFEFELDRSYRGAGAGAASAAASWRRTRHRGWTSRTSRAPGPSTRATTSGRSAGRRRSGSWPRGTRVGRPGGREAPWSKGRPQAQSMIPTTLNAAERLGTGFMSVARGACSLMRSYALGSGFATRTWPVASSNSSLTRASAGAQE
jgi:hypothetical protein